MAGLGAVTWREPQGAFHKKIDRLLDCVHENPVPIIIFTGGGDGGLHHDHGRAIRALLSTPALQCPTLVTLHPAQSGRVGRPCIGKAACLQGILPGVRLEYNPKVETGHVTMANRGIEGQRMAPGRRVTDPGLPESALQFPNTACSTS